MRRRKSLSEEDRLLWAHVARSAVPLKGRRAPDLPAEQKVETQPGAAAPVLAAANPVSPPAPGKSADRLMLHPIERPVKRKIAKGRVPIEARIDLHDKTEAIAHYALLNFLRQAQFSGLRHVLVITGRGASFGSRGVLRRAVPHWFSTREFRPLVTGFDVAERHHGGEGALYVRIRRPRA